MHGRIMQFKNPGLHTALKSAVKLWSIAPSSKNAEMGVSKI